MSEGCECEVMEMSERCECEVVSGVCVRGDGDEWGVMEVCVCVRVCVCVCVGGGLSCMGCRAIEVGVGREMVMRKLCGVLSCRVILYYTILY
jgi:hypothetical protein